MPVGHTWAKMPADGLIKQVLWSDWKARGLQGDVIYVMEAPRSAKCKATRTREMQKGQGEDPPSHFQCTGPCGLLLASSMEISAVTSLD